MFATMSTSAEEQHRKFLEEFCARKYATARSKRQVVVLLKDATLAVEPKVRHSSRIVRLRQTTQNHGKAIIAENCSLGQA